jgi:hypothetical protein
MFGLFVAVPIAIIVSKYLIREKEILYGRNPGGEDLARLEKKVDHLESLLGEMNEKLNAAVLASDDAADLRRSLEQRVKA